MSSIFNSQTLAKISTFRKYLFRVAIWTLIAGVIMGVVMIFASDNTEINTTVGNLTNSLFIAAAGLIVCAICFILLESKKTPVQLFAILTIAASVIWLVLWILSIWNWDVFETCTRNYIKPTPYGTGGYILDAYSNAYTYSCTYSPLFRIASISTYVSIFSFYTALILNLYVGERRDLMRPLRFVDIVLALYLCCFASFVTGDFDTRNPVIQKFSILAIFALISCIIVTFVTIIISYIEKNRARYAFLQNGGVEANPTPEKKHFRVKGRILSKEVVAEENTDNTTKPPQGTDLSTYANQVPPEDITALDSEDSTTPKIKLGPSRIMGESIPPQPKSEAELRAEVEAELRRESIEREIRAKLANRRNADGAYDPDAEDVYPDETYKDYSENADDQEYLLNPFGIKQASAVQEDEDLINAVNELNEHIDEKGHYEENS